MPDFVQEIIASCAWDTTNFLILSNNVFDPFIYYSHIVPLVTSLLIGGFIFFRNRKLLVNQILFALTGAFALWTFFDLILWATDKPIYTMFFWSLINVIEPLIYALSFYFVQVFIQNNDTSLRSKILYSAPLLPIVFLGFSKFNLLGFNLSNCDREAIEGPLAHYIYLIEIFFILAIALFTLHQFLLNKTKDKRRQIILVATSILLFLLSFSWGNIVGSLSDSWRLSQWGLFGMPIFIVGLAYLIIKYNAFNIKIISTQILVTAFPILVGSQYFLTESFGSKLITVITFFLSILAGIFIVKSVEKEVHQREKIEKLAIDLEQANKRLKELDQMKSEFLSFASHQLRSPLTAIKGYTSMALEGDFGKMPVKIKETVQVIDTSAQNLVTIVNDFLNISRIEQGRMKYDYSDFDIVKVTEEVVKELRPNVEQKGLNFKFIPSVESAVVHADLGKIRQVIGNIVDNAIKYTPAGGIEVSLSRTQNKIKIVIKDTGIGIDQSEINNLFSKFTRAKDAFKTNVTGTGLGLYVAKQMMEAQNGHIWVESEGKNKGSTFFIELQLK